MSRETTMFLDDNGDDKDGTKLKFMILWLCDHGIIIIKIDSLHYDYPRKSILSLSLYCFQRKIIEEKNKQKSSEYRESKEENVTA